MNRKFRTEYGTLRVLPSEFTFVERKIVRRFGTLRCFRSEFNVDISQIPLWTDQDSNPRIVQAKASHFPQEGRAEIGPIQELLQNGTPKLQHFFEMWWLRIRFVTALVLLKPYVLPCFRMCVFGEDTFSENHHITNMRDFHGMS